MVKVFRQLAYKSNNNSNKRLDTAKTMTVTLTPVLKGQLTKARNAGQPAPAKVFAFVFNSFLYGMPRQQAKHATRRFLAVTR